MPKNLTNIILLSIFVGMIKTYINLQIYHNHQQLQQQTDRLLSDPRFTKQYCKQDYRIKKIVFKQSQAEISVVMVCNIHARQFFTSELCLEYLKRVQDNKISIKANLTVFYEANTERQNALVNDFCLRTNENGIDLNRNFPFGFSKENDGELNSGNSPLSELFSQCLDSEVQLIKPTVFLDIHTGEFSIYYPEDNGQYFSVLKAVRQICPNCRFRTDNKYDGMAFMDMRHRKKVKWSLLFEVFGGINISLPQQDGCFVMFNPTSKLSYDFYIQRGIKMIEALFESIVQKKQLYK